MVAPDDYPSDLAGSSVEPKLRSLGELFIYDSLPGNTATLIERIKDADVVLGIRGRTCKLTAVVLKECKRLKHIAVYGIGVDHVDLNACKDLGIRVTNTPGHSAVAVAECALALSIILLVIGPTSSSPTGM